MENGTFRAMFQRLISLAGSKKKPRKCIIKRAGDENYWLIDQDDLIDQANDFSNQRVRIILCPTDVELRTLLKYLQIEIK